MTEPFSWTVRLADWPPEAEVKLPFSLTKVEIARSCPLRVIFQSSGRYEPLVSFDARIGTAMHDTLEHFAKHPPQGTDTDVLEHVRHQFQINLNKQREEAAQRPRERNLPEDEERIEAATTALLRAVKGGDIAAQSFGKGGAKPVNQDGRAIQVERPVATKDGRFAGRVDRAVWDESGLTIYDYKSSLLEDVPERYVRQLQMYAEMWTETCGERPDHAYVVYPLTSKQHPVDISPNATWEALAESYRAIQPLLEHRSADELARPGTVCKVCSFKPWCEPFWRWVGEGALPTVLERSALGFQGKVVETERYKEYLILRIAWHPRSLATLYIPWGALPHTRNLTVNQLVRVTGTRLQGQVTAPRAHWTAWTEVHLVET